MRIQVSEYNLKEGPPERISKLELCPDTDSIVRAQQFALSAITRAGSEQLSGPLCYPVRNPNPNQVSPPRK